MSRLAACALIALAALRAPALADSANGSARAEAADSANASSAASSANAGSAAAGSARADSARADSARADFAAAESAAADSANTESATPGSAPADSRGRLHVYAGLFGSAHLVAAQATDYRRGYLDHGAGGGVLAGVRLNRVLAVEAGWRTTANRENLSGARVTNLPLETMVVTTVTAGPRVYWPTGGAVEPYALFSLGYAAILTDFAGCPDCDTLFAGGPAAELGAGVDLRLGRHLSAGLRTSGQVVHFAGDSFEKRFRQADVEPSRTATTILSLATDAYAAFHF
jgi:hypothetical protein